MRVVSADESKCIYYEYNLDEDTLNRTYYVDTDRLYTSGQDAEAKAAIDAILEERETSSSDADALSDACRDYIEQGLACGGRWFRAENDPSFLWIKNVWYPDVSYAHPIQDYNEFSKSFSKNIILANGQKAAIGTIIDAANMKT